MKNMKYVNINLTYFHFKCFFLKRSQTICDFKKSETKNNAITESSSDTKMEQVPQIPGKGHEY